MLRWRDGDRPRRDQRWDSRRAVRRRPFLGGRDQEPGRLPAADRDAASAACLARAAALPDVSRSGPARVRASRWRRASWPTMPPATPTGLPMLLMSADAEAIRDAFPGRPEDRGRGLALPRGRDREAGDPAVERPAPRPVLGAARSSVEGPDRIGPRIPGRPFRLLPDDGHGRLPEPGRGTPEVRLSARRGSGLTPMARRMRVAAVWTRDGRSWRMASGLTPRRDRAKRRKEPVGEVPPGRCRRVRGRRHRRQAVRSFRGRLARVRPARRGCPDPGRPDRRRASGRSGSAQGRRHGSRRRSRPLARPTGPPAIAASGGRLTHRKPPAPLPDLERERSRRRAGHERLVDVDRPGA